MTIRRSAAQTAWIVVLLVLVRSVSYGAGGFDLYTYSNPVIHAGSADPAVIKASDGRYYLYNTFGFSIWVSDDLATWSYAGSAHPAGSWGVADFWAPEVIEYEGKFYLFYSAERPEGGKRIGLAIGDRPTGPFRDIGRPLFDFGFPTIDAHPFIASDGTKYLFFSMDQVPTFGGRHESHIYGIRLSDDLRSVVGEPVFLLRPDQPWEMRSGNSLWNEAPYVIEREGTFYLMYSANFFGGRDYSVGYATAAHPLGPYTKYAGNPILSRGAWGGRLSGPGHHSVVASPDDTELFIVYHIHADPAAGGGDRRVAIDRMGFRPDGSLYVSGPTLTPQPLPSGATELVNLAPYATLSTDQESSQDRLWALTDGEITVDAAKADNEWTTEGATAWIRLSWDRVQRARQLFIYGSVLANRRPLTAAVTLSDGTQLQGIEFPRDPGAAAIVDLPDERDITWIEIALEGFSTLRPELALSEVIVLGYPGGLPGAATGSVWISSPKRAAVVADRTPVRVEALNVSVEHVRLELDGEVFYEGPHRPHYGTVDPWALAEGTHRITAVVKDVSGLEFRYVSEFVVQHVALRSPEWGDPVTGELVIELEAVIPAEHVKSFDLHLVPAGGADRAVPVYSDTEVPERIAFATWDLTDGAYDLVTTLVTSSGVVSTQKTRVVVTNWTVLDDPIAPPEDAGWFGTFPRIKTESMSRGWLYATGDAEDFFGDADRIGTAGTSEEYLIWRLPNLDRFELTFYASRPEIAGAVVVAVSDNGADWLDVPYSISVVDVAPEIGRYKLAVYGEIPATWDVSQLRIRSRPPGWRLRTCN